MSKITEKTKNHIKHIVATGLIVNQNYTKMLLVYHKKLNKWAAPGGHVEKNETPEQGAIREIMEETGVNVNFISEPRHELDLRGENATQLETPYAVLYELIPETPKEGPEHIHVDFLYVFEADDNDVIRVNKNETNDVRWFTREEITKIDAFPAIKKFAEKFLIQ